MAGEIAFDALTESNIQPIDQKLINEYLTQIDVFRQRKMDLKCIKPELFGLENIIRLFSNCGSLYWMRKIKNYSNRVFNITL